MSLVLVQVSFKCQTHTHTHTLLTLFLHHNTAVLPVQVQRFVPFPLFPVE